VSFNSPSAAVQRPCSTSLPLVLDPLVFTCGSRCLTWASSQWLCSRVSARSVGCCMTSGPPDSSRRFKLYHPSNPVTDEGQTGAAWPHLGSSIPFTAARRGLPSATHVTHPPLSIALSEDDGLTVAVLIILDHGQPSPRGFSFGSLGTTHNAKGRECVNVDTHNTNRLWRLQRIRYWLGSVKYQKQMSAEREMESLAPGRPCRPCRTHAGWWTLCAV
jgi:hypothetical protein